MRELKRVDCGRFVVIQSASTNSVYTADVLGLLSSPKTEHFLFSEATPFALDLFGSIVLGGTEYSEGVGP